MTLNDYQQAASLTALYPSAGTGRPVALAYCALGLSEVHELMSAMDDKVAKLQSIIKKAVRSDDSVKGHLIKLPLTNIIDELGDLLWYMSQLARELNVDFDDVAIANLSKLAQRMQQNDIKSFNHKDTK